MKDRDKLKRWELALVLSLSITLCHGLAVDAPGAAWWGVIFPGLAGGSAPAETVETVKLDNPGGVQIRFQLLDWLDSLFQ